MSLTKTFATTGRVLRQLHHDPRTIALVMVVPCVLVTLLKYVFDKQQLLFNNVAPMILGIFPLLIMFLITSIATLRERKTGTLDRLLTMPISKFDFIFGYGIAFSILAFVQACVVSLVMLGFLGVTVAGGTLPLLISAVLAALLGTAMGLFVSAFATSEFQAVQLVMPSLMPQILLCGLFAPRESMNVVLQRLSDIFPLTYSVDAMKQLTTNTGWTGQLTKDFAVVGAFTVVSLVLAAITIRRQE